MSRTGSGFARIAVLGVALALALLLLGAREAQAGKYAVAQCGWYVGADASWADTTGGAKFRQDGWCVPPAGQDPFNGVHLKSFTREGQGTVSGTRFGRWRWEAPAGTAISQVRGTWWHALHDGMEHRIGVGTWGGGFDVFAAASATDTALREFVAGFNPPQPALESRLLCARLESKWCSLDRGSWVGVRALTITVQDDHWPVASIGGDVLTGGWRRGGQNVAFWGADTGSGLRLSETFVDGGRVNLTEYGCAKALIGSEWRATAMRPCSLGIGGNATIDTTRFSDGPHSAHHCIADFAGNVGCTPAHGFLVDNNPPAHPRKLTLAGGEEWHRTNDFDALWTNPDQGAASPIGGAFWRIEGPAGYDSGVRYAAGRGRTTLENLAAPRVGVFTLRVWLRDEAGNEAPGTAVDVPLRFDEVAPGIAFERAPDTVAAEDALPEVVRAQVDDAHSGPESGQIHYRRIEAEQWTELPTKFERGSEASTAHLVARLPETLPAGTYLFRAEGLDRAGNTATTTRRADGTEMSLRRRVAVVEARRASAPRPQAKTRLFARLRWRRQSGPAVTIPFGGTAVLSGRLIDADGAGLGGRELRVVSRPSRGALSRPSVRTIGTGPQGGFRLPLPVGPSRRVTVNYRGDDGLEPSRRPALALRVRSGLLFRAAPHTLRTGELVRFHGRVRAAGAPLPRRGKLVAIQYYESAARRWRPVLVTRSDHDGRFRARYRFRYVSGMASIRLRAVALAEERWPYVPGASRPVTVEVSG
ncbi:MAG TPA: hypothetical protein VNO20_03235 [Solirubrobacterales bacterium]|nr:hypothetical protein [Solirubrobacterales bacterium]